ncbi:MAG: hypothetical protein OEZ59_04845 [Deltaproteobacteria bacterium]|nr:hypothetical protein [Deltaproteobacteria bacterium]
MKLRPGSYAGMPGFHLQAVPRISSRTSFPNQETTPINKTLKAGIRLAAVLLVCLAVSFSAAGCRTGRGVSQPALETDPDFRPEKFARFLVERPLLPFQADGSMQFNYRDQRESGELVLHASAAGSYRIRLLARLTGSLLLELRFDPQRIQVWDFINETILDTENTPPHRISLFGLDLTPAEFQVLFTGRVVGRDFGSILDQAAPPPTAAGEEPQRKIEFRRGSIRHSFLLGQHGYPEQWEKFMDDELQFRVDYRRYFSHESERGTLMLPRTVRVYRRDEQQAVFLIGIRNLNPGSTPRVSLGDTPAGAEDFQPVTLAAP